MKNAKLTLALNFFLLIFWHRKLFSFLTFLAFLTQKAFHLLAARETPLLGKTTNAESKYKSFSLAPRENMKYFGKIFKFVDYSFR